MPLAQLDLRELDAALSEMQKNGHILVGQQYPSVGFDKSARKLTGPSLGAVRDELVRNDELRDAVLRKFFASPALQKLDVISDMLAAARAHKRKPGEVKEPHFERLANTLHMDEHDAAPLYLENLLIHLQDMSSGVFGAVAKERTEKYSKAENMDELLALLKGDLSGYPREAYAAIMKSFEYYKHHPRAWEARCHAMLETSGVANALKPEQERTLLANLVQLPAVLA